MENYQYVTFSVVQKYLENLSADDQVKVDAEMRSLCRHEYGSIRTKKLRGPIKELIVKEHRIMFFTHQSTIFFIGAFTKKSQKTPRKEIEGAEKMHHKIISSL